MAWQAANLLKLAWRNVWRNRRRTLITMAAIVFAVFITALMRSLQYGTYDALEAYAVSLFTGELQIQRQGFEQERTLNYSMRDQPERWQMLVGSMPALHAYARRVNSFGLVSSDSSSTGAMIVGIEPASEAEVTTFSTAEMLAAGEPLSPDDRLHVLLGKQLADNLGLRVGDSVVVITQGYRNQLGANLYHVKGLMRTGNVEFDRNLMVMTLDEAQELFSMPGRITEVVLKSSNFRRAGQYASMISTQLDGETFDVLTWRELLPELEQTIALDNIGGAIFLVFLLLVVGFEILNTTMMSFVERVREFGILQAIGLKPRQLGWLITLEAGIKITLALAIGFLLSYAVLAVMSHYPIPLSDELKEAMSEYGFITDMYFSVGGRVFLEPLLSIAVISFLSLLYPIRLATRLTPVEAMRRV